MDTIAKVEAQLEIQSGLMEAMEADKSNWELERRKMRELVSCVDGLFEMSESGTLNKVTASVSFYP